MKEVYTVWAEWGIGVNHCIYSSYEAAEKNLDAALKEHVGISLEEAIAQNLAGIDQQEVIED